MTAPISSYWKFQLKNVLPMNIMTHRARPGSHLLKCIRRVLDFILEPSSSFRATDRTVWERDVKYALLHARAVIIVCAIVLFLIYCVMGVAKA